MSLSGSSDSRCSSWADDQVAMSSFTGVPRRRSARRAARVDVEGALAARGLFDTSDQRAHRCGHSLEGVRRAWRRRAITRRRASTVARRLRSSPGPEFSRPPRLCPWGLGLPSGIASPSRRPARSLSAPAGLRGSPHRARCRAAAPAVSPASFRSCSRNGERFDNLLLGDSSSSAAAIVVTTASRFSSRSASGFDSSISSARVFPAFEEDVGIHPLLGELSFHRSQRSVARAVTISSGISTVAASTAGRPRRCGSLSAARLFSAAPTFSRMSRAAPRACRTRGVGGEVVVELGEIFSRTSLTLI